MLTHGRELLVKLRALDPQGKVTSQGRQMAGVAAASSIGPVRLCGFGDGGETRSLDLAARLSKAATVSSEITWFRHRGAASGRFTIQCAAASTTVTRTSADFRSWQAGYACVRKGGSAAFPDRVARKRGDRLLLANGTAAQLDKSSFAHGDYLVAIEVDDREGQTPLVRIASAIEPDWLLDLFPDSIEPAKNWLGTGKRSG